MKKVFSLLALLTVLAKASFAGQPDGVGPCDWGVVATFLNSATGTLVSTNTGGGYICDLRISSGNLSATGGVSADFAVCADSRPIDSSKTIAAFEADPTTDSRVILKVNSSSGIVTGVTAPFKGVEFENLVCDVSAADTPAIVYWHPGR